MNDYLYSRNKINNLRILTKIIQYLKKIYKIKEYLIFNKGG